MPFSRSALSARYAVARMAVRQAICYPADVIIEFISYPLAFICYFYFVLAVFKHGGGIGDNSLSDLISYFSVAWVLRMILDQGAADKLASDVQSGDVALYLVRPMSLGAYHFSRYVGLGLARTIYYGLPAWILLSLLFGDQISAEPGRFLWFLVYALIAFRLAFEIQYLLGLSSFYILVNKQVTWSVDLVIRLASGLVVPLYLFPGAVATALALLPFQYLYYKPIQALLEPIAPWSLMGGIAIGAIWIVLFNLANRFVLSAALRRHVIQGS